MLENTQVSFILVIVQFFAICTLLGVLIANRRKMVQQIWEGILKGKSEANKKGYDAGYKKAREEITQEQSRPLSPTKLPPGEYTVEYVLYNGTVPLAAVAIREIVEDKGTDRERRHRESWFVSLPSNRRLTCPVPFLLVVDNAGIGYEPVRQPEPTSEPPKVAEAAA